MNFFAKAILIVLLVAIGGGVAYLAVWDIPPPTHPVEKSSRMIVLRASQRTRRAVATLSCLIALVAGAPVFAQGVEPAQLGPTPLHQAREPAEGEPPPAIERPAGAVRVERLGVVSREVIGLTDADQQRFGLDLWRGTRRVVVETLLPHLPSRIRSPAMRLLARRLLLTAAEPPAGEAGETPLIALRIERLIAMGAIDDARELLTRAPASDDPRPCAGDRATSLATRRSGQRLRHHARR